MGRVEYIATECYTCGKEYTQMVIDGRTDHVHICGECLNKIATKTVRDGLDEYIKKGILG